MPDILPDEARLAAEIDRLKAEFPKTRELYREVCALMFFRFGITPTANRLYQLVRRGSMGTPTAVLGEFWSELREKSRVRIEHADMPEELQDAAGEFVGALWNRASAAAEASLAALRDEVEEARRAAQAAMTALQADLARTETALEQRTAALLAAQVRIHELEQAQAANQTSAGALEAEVARLQAAEKRAALENDRERASHTRLQREAEAAARRAARAEEGARTEIQSLQTQLGDLRHQSGMLEGHLEALRATHAAQGRELDTLRQKLGGAEPTAPRATRRVGRPAAEAAKPLRPHRKGSAQS
ncbi:DNA-binding protein [Paraburkholderia sp. B3]|uniref:DNA-binding protein n=1 Tax=Paraburkholderia sp. B3 TaxID=3134791 RepID=UPI003982AE4A